MVGVSPPSRSGPTFLEEHVDRRRKQLGQQLVAAVNRQRIERIHR